jgi:hypothetical protein
MNYNFNIKKFVGDYFAYILRKTKFLALAECLASPIQSLVYSFLIYIETTRYNLKITGQTIVLQNFLNDKMDFIQRRILIIHPIIAENYIWKKIENQSSDFVPFKNELYNTFFVKYKNENETGILDFIVKIPSDISLQIPKIKAFVEAYKLAGKTYKIEVI